VCYDAHLTRAIRMTDLEDCTRISAPESPVLSPRTSPGTRCWPAERRGWCPVRLRHDSGHSSEPVAAAKPADAEIGTDSGEVHTKQCRGAHKPVHLLDSRRRASSVFRGVSRTAGSALVLHSETGVPPRGALEVDGLASGSSRGGGAGRCGRSSIGTRRPRAYPRWSGRWGAGRGAPAAGSFLGGWGGRETACSPFEPGGGARPAWGRTRRRRHRPPERSGRVGWGRSGRAPRARA
jgi:hypothetical protein